MVPEAPEEGDTFEEIARKKANFYYHQIRKPVLAEDSGLVIPALDGFPGILSARIAETDSERIRIILDKLKAETNRSAFYHCSMVFMSSSGIIETQGRCEGSIAETPRGALGFGYDPVFVLQETDRTFGEMNLEEKAKHSHRGRALSTNDAATQELDSK